MTRLKKEPRTKGTPVVSGSPVKQTRSAYFGSTLRARRFFSRWRVIAHRYLVDELRSGAGSKSTRFISAFHTRPLLPGDIFAARFPGFFQRMFAEAKFHRQPGGVEGGLDFHIVVEIDIDIAPSALRRGR